MEALQQTPAPTAGDVVAWEENPSGSRIVGTVSIPLSDSDAAVTMPAGTVLAFLTGDTTSFVPWNPAYDELTYDAGVADGGGGADYAPDDTGNVLLDGAPIGTYVVTTVDEDGAVTALTVTLSVTQVAAAQYQTETGGVQAGAGIGLVIEISNVAGGTTGAEIVRGVLLEMIQGEPGENKGPVPVLVRGPAKVRATRLSAGGEYPEEATAELTALGIKLF